MGHNLSTQSSNVVVLLQKQQLSKLCVVQSSQLKHSLREGDQEAHVTQEVNERTVKVETWGSLI